MANGIADDDDDHRGSSSTSLLRRVAIPASRLLQDDNSNNIILPDEDDVFADGVFFDLYDSPCIMKVSDDPFTIDDIDNFEPCNLTFYGGCLDDVSTLEATANQTDAGDESVLALDVTYDYEMYARRGANTTNTLAFLEGSVLEHMATAVGLDECDDLGVRKLNVHFTDEEAERFLGVDSADPDVVDTQVDCFVPVTSAVANVGECIPVSGSLRAYVSNDPPLSDSEKISIQSNMLRLIRAGMRNDVYVSGNVLQAVFIGQRDTNLIAGGARRDPQQTQNNRNDGLTNRNVIIIVSVIIVMAICLIIGTIVMTRRQREQRQRRRREEAAARTEDTDTECVHPLRPGPVGKPTSSSRITVLNDQASASSGDDSSNNGRPSRPSPPWLRPKNPKPVKDRLNSDDHKVPTIHQQSSLDRICDNASNSSIDWNEGQDDATE